MGAGAIITIVVLLLILVEVAVLESEVLWHRPDRKTWLARLEGRATLTMAVSLLLLTPYALIEGRLWAAGGLRIQWAIAAEFVPQKQAGDGARGAGPHRVIWALPRRGASIPSPSLSPRAPRMA